MYPNEFLEGTCGCTLSWHSSHSTARWQCCGDYTLTEKLHNDRPVYRSSEGRHLYTLERAWAVSPVSWGVGHPHPVLRSTTPAPSPALSQNWEYKDFYDGDKYKPGDIKVTLNK